MSRKILEDRICEKCKLAIEDSVHTVWSCLELDVVWADQENGGLGAKLSSHV